jgi:hypothetical protein
MFIMKFCNIWTAVAVVFLVANIYVSVSADHGDLKDAFYSTISEDQIDKYETIVSERKRIYFGGYTLGLILSLMFLLGITHANKSSLFGWGIAGAVGGIVMLTNYFFYILYPKSDYMVLHLEDESQRRAWHDIYRYMQVRYHTGIVLGVLAAVFMAKSFC